MCIRDRFIDADIHFHTLEKVGDSKSIQIFVVYIYMYVHVQGSWIKFNQLLVSSDLNGQMGYEYHEYYEY